jgi:hypothetical protein
MYCPTCGTAYNIENGMVDEGPSMRNLAVYPNQLRKGLIQAVVPENIAPFNAREPSMYSDVDPRIFCVLGDSEAALSVMLALRSAFTGKIVCVPTAPYGQFQNKDVLLRKMGPLEKHEVYYVEDDFF